MAFIYLQSVILHAFICSFDEIIEYPLIGCRRALFELS
jgi:hypothetical protein